MTDESVSFWAGTEDTPTVGRSQVRRIFGEWTDWSVRSFLGERERKSVPRGRWLGYRSTVNWDRRRKDRQSSETFYLLTFLRTLPPPDLPAVLDLSWEDCQVEPGQGAPSDGREPRGRHRTRVRWNRKRGVRLVPYRSLLMLVGVMGLSTGSRVGPVFCVTRR